MKLPVRTLVTAAASLAVFTVVTAAWAETCTLELKKLDQQNGSGINYMYAATSPQTIFVQLDKNHAPIGNQGILASFKKIVTKEPKYASENPFRGVIKLGSQEFAFVLDVVPPPEEKTDADKAKKKDEEKPKGDAAEKKPAPSAVAFNRLYFDLNHNGDLTDDKPIDVTPQRGRPIFAAARQYATFQFPRVDITIDDEGTKMEYCFFLQGQSVIQPDFSYVMARFSAAAYREGDITLDGKKRHIVLIDFNSNGRFGDEIKINPNMHAGNGQVYPEQGDMLLIDPTASNVGSPYDVTTSDNRHYVSKLINIDGKYYDMTISPAGDKLTLDPCSTALGSVKNPNGGFRAVIYGDLGFLKIRGAKDAAIPVPEGEWKLLSYTIDRTDADEPKKPDAKKSDKTAKSGSMLESLAKDLGALLDDGPAPGARNRLSTVTAAATDAYKPVKVVKGETVTMPFGPPYKPTVTGQYYEDSTKHKVLSLGMSLVGSAGEICSNMIVNGGRPTKPKFTITDGAGKVVQEGSFEYG
jgi:hypothetical protein